MCENALDDVILVLKDCSVAKKVRYQLILVEKRDKFFSGNLQEWLESNLGNPYKISLREVDWQCFFGLMVWCIWKN